MLFNRTTEGGQGENPKSKSDTISSVLCVKTTKNPKNLMKSDKIIIFKKTSTKITQLMRKAVDFNKRLHYIVLL